MEQWHSMCKTSRFIFLGGSGEMETYFKFKLIIEIIGLCLAAIFLITLGVVKIKE